MRTQASHRTWNQVFTIAVSALWFVVLGTANVPLAWADEEKAGEVESRGMSQMQRPMQPGAPTKTNFFQLPTWPQQWQVNNREPYGVAFGVTQPGPVTVDVQAQGAPIVVELFGATPQVVQRQTGSGAIRLMYQVTPADVQRSALWQVRILLAQPGGPPTQAAGTISVQHPPADVNVIRAQMQASMAQRRAIDPQTAATMKAKMDALFHSEVAKLKQEQAVRSTTLIREAPPQLPAKTIPSGQIRPRGLEGNDQPPEEPGMAGTASESEAATRAVPSPKNPGMVMDRSNLAPTIEAIEAQMPYIIGFSRWQAQPGDRVVIDGVRFSNSAEHSQVLIMLKGMAPGGNLSYVAQVRRWSDTQIEINVPNDISGIANVTNADVVVVRGTDGMRSDPRKDYGELFRIQPVMELRALPLPPPIGDSFVHHPWDPNETIYLGDTTGTASSLPSDSSTPPGWQKPNAVFNEWSVWVQPSFFLGDTGHDQFFMKKQLKNGWRVRATYVIELDTQQGHSGAYLWESRIGTSSPFVNVRTWQTPATWLVYTVRVWIIGPKGVPHE